MIKHVISLLLVFVFATTLHAQQDLYRWRLGVHLGYMNYIGDKTIVPFTEKPVSLPYGVDLQYNFTPSFGINVMADRGKFSIPASETDASQPDFETEAKSISFRVVYHFDNGKLLHARSPFSPYLFAGGGFGWYEIKSAVTENVRTGFIPAGLGLKARLSNRFNLDLRGDMRYAFTDKLDANVSSANNRNDFYYLITLSGHFNFGMRKAKFKSPAFYTGEKGWKKVSLEKTDAARKKIQFETDTLKAVEVDIVMKADTAALVKKDAAPVQIKKDIQEIIPPKEKGVRILLNDSIISIMVNENESLDFLMDPKLFRSLPDVQKPVIDGTETAQMQNEIARLQDEVITLNRLLDSLSKDAQQTSIDTVAAVEKIGRTEATLREMHAAETVQDTVIAPVIRLRDETVKSESVVKNDTLMHLVPVEEISEIIVDTTTQKLLDADRVAPIPKKESNVNAPHPDTSADTVADIALKTDAMKHQAEAESEIFRTKKTADIQQQKAAQPKTDTVVLKTITEKTVSETSMRESAVQPQAHVINIQTEQELDKANAERITGLQTEIEALKMQLLSQEQKVESDTVDDVVKDTLAQRDSRGVVADSVDAQNRVTIATQPQIKENRIDSADFKALLARIDALQSEIDSLQNTAITEIIRDTVVVEALKQEPAIALVTVYFARNSSVVEDRYKKELADFAKTFLALPKTAMALMTGFADKTGNPDYNKMLSERRALAVKKALTANQISDARILIRFFGDEIAEPGTNEADRKVEVKVLYQE